MSEAIGFLDGIIDERLAHLHTAMPCRVESYNESEGTCDVVPLFMRKFVNGSAQQLPKLIDLPVMKRKRKTVVDGEVVPVVDEPYYERGDVVLVLFAERALDRVRSGKVADPQYGRKHALEDGIIIGYLGWN